MMEFEVYEPKKEEIENYAPGFNGNVDSNRLRYVMFRKVGYNSMFIVQ